MNKFFFLLFCPVLAFGQHQPIPHTEVPESVRSSFETTFPGAKVRTWEREKYGLYEAEFTWKGRATSATYNANGLLQRTESEVPIAEMPADIMTHSREMFPDYKVGECARITTPDGRALYEVEITRNNERRSLIFDDNNTFLRVEVDEDDDDLDRSGKKG